MSTLVPGEGLVSLETTPTRSMYVLTDLVCLCVCACVVMLAATVC